MAVSSPLNPGSIVKERQANMPAAMNFISGGAPLGSSVVSSAANKIVGFQRGAAAVAAKPPDLSSIIKTLSTSILNNVENKVQSINQNIQQFVQGNFNKQLGEYRERLQSVDNDAPNKILKNFLSLYKDAIGYIQFLGNRRNVQQLGENLKSLQLVFSETFEVAKIIRQTIVRIVKQLSNLPRSSGSGGSGIDLDIKVPGGPLRKALPSKRNMLKMAGMAGAIGSAGMLGSKVVSGMMDIGGEDQITTTPSDFGQGLSGPLLDRFNAVLDRFDSAINNLAKVKPSVQTGGGSSGAKVAPPKEPSKTPGTTGATVSSAPGDEKLAAFVASMEASSPENAADAMQVMLNRTASGYSKQGLAGVLSGYDQFSPISAAIYGKSADKAAAAKYGPIAQKLPGNTAEEKFKYLQQIAAKPDGLQELQRIFSGGSASTAATILNDPKYLAASRQNVKGALNFYGGNIQQAGDVRIRQGGNVFYNFTGKVGTLSGQPTANVPVAAAAPQVTPAPTKSTTTQQIAQTVSQPPATQSKSQVNVVPLNMSSPQTQSTPVGQKVPPPPVLSKGGATVPFLTSTNHDNFMTLYSKIVYNLVD